MNEIEPLLKEYWFDCAERPPRTTSSNCSNEHSDSKPLLFVDLCMDALEEGEVIDVASQPGTQIVDMLGGVLNNGIRHVLRRGLHRGYVSHKETIPGVRGKIDISATVKAGDRPGAAAVCEFDELSHDVGHNRILRSTVQGLLRLGSLDPKLRDDLAGTNRRLQRLKPTPFQTVVSVDPAPRQQSILPVSDPRLPFDP